MISLAATGAKRLADRFGSLEAIIAADWLDLRQVERLNATRARTIEAQLREFGMHWQSPSRSHGCGVGCRLETDQGQYALGLSVPDEEASGVAAGVLTRWTQLWFQKKATSPYRVSDRYNWPEFCYSSPRPVKVKFSTYLRKSPSAVQGTGAAWRDV